MANNIKKKQFSVSGKKYSDTAESNITYDIDFWTNASGYNYAYTNVKKPLWNAADGFDNSSNIKHGITQFVHAVNIDWDNPATTEIPSIYTLNEENPIKSTDDIFYVLEKIGQHFIDYKPNQLSITYNADSSNIGTYNLVGKINGDSNQDQLINQSITWSCNNKYAKLSNKVGSTTTLTIDFESMIKDHLKIREISEWSVNSNATNKYNKNFEAYWDQNFDKSSSEEGLKFIVTAQHNSIFTPVTQTIIYNSDNINISGGQWIIDELGVSTTNSRLSVSNYINNNCTLVQTNKPDELTYHNLYISPKLSNGYYKEFKIGENQNTTPDNLLEYPHIQFSEYFTNVNDIYITTISADEFNDTNFINNIKNNILNILNVRLYKIWALYYNLFDITKSNLISNNILTENDFSKDYLVICYPSVPFSLIDPDFNRDVTLNESTVILQEDFNVNTNSLYYKKFKIKIYNRRGLELYSSVRDASHCGIGNIYTNQYFTIKYPTGDPKKLTFNIPNDLYNDSYITSLEYSVDNGRSWSSTTENSNSYKNISINTTDQNLPILVRANARKFAKADYNDILQMYEINKYVSINGGGKDFDVYGNIMSLLWENDFINKTQFKQVSGTNISLCTYVFAYLFYNSSVRNANNLILPSTNLTTGCYSYMFSNCSKLNGLPNISISPSMSLAESCYEGMYEGCNNLINIGPEYFVYITRLKTNCMHNMFHDCTSLKNVPYLAYFTETAPNCCESMFEGCIGLTQIENNENNKLKASILYSNCYASMFFGCSNLKSIPNDFLGINYNNTTKLAESCYSNMFANTGLIEPPVVQKENTVLAKNCYNGMFGSCSNLTTIPTLNTNNNLQEGCYKSMFNNCTKLRNLQEFKLNVPSYTVPVNCYYEMFRNCTSLNISPILGDATTFGKDCYAKMFYGCKNLSQITFLVKNISENNIKNSFSEWVADTYETGKFIRSIDATWPEYTETSSKSIVPLKWLINNKTKNLGLQESVDNTEVTNSYLRKPFYIEVANDYNSSDKTIIITLGSNTTNLVNNLSYQLNNTNGSWTKITSKIGNKIKISIPSTASTGYKIYFKVNDNIETLNSNNEAYCTISTDFNYYIGGNIMSLLYNNTMTNEYVDNKEYEMKLKNYALTKLFSIHNASENTTNGNNINLIGFKNDFILPAKEIGISAYEGMFEGCEKAKDYKQTADTVDFAFPIILAKVITEKSMQQMFYNCKEITKPRLFVSYIDDNTNSTSQNQACYKMFAGCTKLSGSISLYTNCPKSYSYFGMFNKAVNENTGFNIFLYNNYNNNETPYYVGITNTSVDDSWISAKQQGLSGQYNIYYYKDPDPTKAIYNANSTWTKIKIS